MGNTWSKKHENNEIKPTNIDQNGVIDPRSPTPEIVRTPLQSKSVSKHNITKNVDLRKTFEAGEDMEKLILNNPILTAVIKNHLQSYDPRSPTQDFERTPITLTSKYDEDTDKNLMRLQSPECNSPTHSSLNDSDYNNSQVNLSKYEDAEIQPTNVIKNLLDEFLYTSEKQTIPWNDVDVMLNIDSLSTKTLKDTDNLVTDKKVLETDFDYIDTEIEPDQSSNKSLRPLSKIISEASRLDPRSPTIGIERTPLVFTKSDSDSPASITNVEELSDDTLIQVLQSANAEFRQSIKACEKNQGLLIYEDSVETPRKVKLSNNSGSRTPLSCVKNKPEESNEKSKTNISLKKSSEGSSKIPKRVSQIPRLQSLTKATKPEMVMSSISLKSSSQLQLGECENTPPHSHRDIWDKESSIVV